MIASRGASLPHSDSVPDRDRWRLLLVVVLCILASGCASFGRGVTEAVMTSQGRDQQDRRRCEVDGASFTGLEARLDEQAQRKNVAPEGADQPATKLVYIHGIGSQQPGHGARLLRATMQELDLTVRAKRSKRIVLAPPSPPQRPMGEVNLVRIFDAQRERELVFVELTWDAITLQEREALAFDSSSLYTSQRAALNQTIRNFTNSTLPDPLAFAGSRGGDILDAVQQTLCWAVSASWEELPFLTEGMRCEDSPLLGSRVEDDELVIATHSLGSRAAMDALQLLAQMRVGKNNDAVAQPRPLAGLSEKSITMFMLSNQLALLQPASSVPRVTGSREAYCRSGAPRAADRLLRRLDLIAITDPNDLLSFPVPQHWIDAYVDPRLCTEVRNVTINVAHVRNLPLLGEFADPLTAHTGYVGDARVVALMAGGIGQDTVRPLTAQRCTWIEVDATLN